MRRTQWGRPGTGMRGGRLETVFPMKRQNAKLSTTGPQGAKKIPGKHRGKWITSHTRPCGGYGGYGKLPKWHATWYPPRTRGPRELAKGRPPLIPLMRNGRLPASASLSRAPASEAGRRGQRKKHGKSGAYRNKKQDKEHRDQGKRAGVDAHPKESAVIRIDAAGIPPAVYHRQGDRRP